MKPTCEELYKEDGYEELVCHDIDAQFGGTLIEEVYLRESDGTYWAALYLFSYADNVNGLRDGNAIIYEVQKQTVVKDIWVREFSA